MNTNTLSALALLFLLWVQAANAAEPPIPPSEALSDSQLQEVTGQKAFLLRPHQPDQTKTPTFHWPPGGCIPHPKPKVDWRPPSRFHRN